MRLVDAELVFAQYWTDDDPFEQDRKKGIKCAEVLVPGKVAAEYINGAYVSSVESKRALRKLAPELELSINAHMFFQPVGV